MTTIIFDMDGILIDTERLYMDVWCQAGVEMGYDIGTVQNTVKECVGLSSTDTRKLCEERFGVDAYEKVRKNADSIFMRRVNEEGIPVKPGAYMLLEYLKRNKYTIGLASSTKYNIIVEELTDLKMIDYFKVIVGGDMVEKGKPAPDVYLKACTQLNVAPKNAVAIEDSPNGLMAAKRAGMRTIMVPDMIPFDEKMSDLVDEKFNSLTDILEALRKGEKLF